MTVVHWEEDPTRTRVVERRCRRCLAMIDDDFDIVSPAGTGHRAAEWNEGYTACGIDATGLEWWWRT